MILSRLGRIAPLRRCPLQNQNVKLHYNYTPHPEETPPNSQEWFNTAISIVQCATVVSILWGAESYNEKTKIIHETNKKMDDMMIAYRLLERKCTKTMYQFKND
jgi:hypothetical protein